MSRILFVFAAILLVAGCAAPEILEARNGMAPAGVDLGGNWQIRPENERDRRLIREAIRKTDGVKDDEIFPQSSGQPSASSRYPTRSRRSGGVNGGLVHVFLEVGQALKITQTPHGLFISFDRSVVKEYRFGENRVANIGEVEAQRVTGWEGDTLVIETLDRNNMKLTERFRLIEDARVLERTIILRSKEMQEETIVQLFDRVAA